jgi:hypothetical protein
MERRKEFFEFIHDRWAGARNWTAISFPAIISFLLDIQGKPYVLWVGLYLFLFFIIVINSVYILSLEDKERGLAVGATVRYSAKYPSLRVPAIGSLAFLFVSTVFIAVVPTFRQPFVYSIIGLPTSTPTITPTITLTFTRTPIPTSTSTATPIPTATPKEQGIFYMFVLDASVTMLESFEAQTKWDAALRAVDSILVGLEDGANYGLVAIGGAPGIGSSNPCDEPSLLSVPFSTSKADVGGRVAQLQPGGGGSLYKAFVLAVDELDSLPESTVRSLIYITGSEDACENQDEWADLERFFKIRGDARLDIYSEIIIIDERNGIRTQTIADRISNLSDRVNVQAPQTVFQLLQSNDTVINNISNYVDITISAFPTNTPTSTPIITSTKTPGTSSNITPPVIVTTVTPSLTPTWTPSITPSITLAPTDTLYPELLYITNLQNGQVLDCSTGQVCIINVNIQWVPESQSQGRYLSVWVRPIPELPDGQGQDYYAQNPPQHQGNGIWVTPDCYIGRASDPNGLNFAVYVLAANQPYDASYEPQLTLPSYITGTSVIVKRGNP